MINTEKEISAILNLQTNDSIGLELAHRQLAVISKSYQYLSNSNNNIVYIADEVGLGKTYIAIGIMMLFRHFSTNVNLHKDVIIVPKKNLQTKWNKEIRNFVNNNYISSNDTIKEQYNKHIGIKDRLNNIVEEDSISIFRMTSFSSILNLKSTKQETKNYLKSDIFNNNAFAAEIIEEAWKLGYFNNNEEANLRKLIAYLFNALSPKINCLVVDEAHNYKYGIGSFNNDQSIRNEMTARFLGSVIDKDLISDFPSLKQKIKFPLAQKIICLSATPKDRSLLEIKNQFNCFTNKHILSHSNTKEDVEILLKQFLIRGNLEYNLGAEIVSRNQCREEHRKGNVNKSEIPEPLKVEDTFDSVFWQLLQYKSIKHLSQKNNASFEIGMLASFETYMADLDTKSSKKNDSEIIKDETNSESKEYEQIATRTQKESYDINIIRGIIKSYHKEFASYPPHPKQSKLEDEIINQLKRQEKSLIFVRRVATSIELEKRINDRFEKEIIVEQYLKFSGKFIKYKTKAVELLIDSFKNKRILENLDDVLYQLLGKVEIKRIILAYELFNEAEYYLEGMAWLNIAYHSSKSDVFKTFVNDFINRNLINISNSFKDVAIVSVKEVYELMKGQINNDIEEDEVEDEFESNYFFLDYFKKGREGFSYKQKMYRENWFDINPIILNNFFNFYEYNVSELNLILSKIVIDNKKKKSQTFKIASDATFDFFIKNASISNSINISNDNIPDLINENTFITRLLCNYCKTEMSTWFYKRINKNKVPLIYKDLKILNSILKNIFRNGSGLLPGFVAESIGQNFEAELLNLVTNNESPFLFVLAEVKSIITNFDLIVAANFQTEIKFDSAIEEKKINIILRNQTPIVGTSGQDVRDRGILASQFRMPGYPYVLITTDIFREGEDLHTFCQNIYHYGIAWNPSDMEQRTGRIDRINSLSYRMLNSSQQLSFQNKIQIFYPYLSNSVEVNQVVQLLHNLNKFIDTFNDIVVENKYESLVSINQEITEENIPKAIKERLVSKYDVGEFEV